MAGVTRNPLYVCLYALCTFYANATDPSTSISTTTSTLEPSAEIGSKLTAYWDLGSCGASGSNSNWEWCNKSLFKCMHTVSTPDCPSGEADLLYTRGNGRGSMSLTLNGCSYVYLAQYHCTGDSSTTPSIPDLGLATSPNSPNGKLAAYRDIGSCGPLGDNQNWQWCGRQGFECQHTVSTSECPSGKAELLSTHGSGKVDSPVSLDGCNYVYFAQYQCSSASMLTTSTLPPHVPSEHVPSESTLTLAQLSAYWGGGSCGLLGEDHNSQWCGRERFECKKIVSTSLCLGENAVLSYKAGAGSLISPVTIDGCQYSYFAQYGCPPVQLSGSIGISLTLQSARRLVHDAGSRFRKLMDTSVDRKLVELVIGAGIQAVTGMTTIKITSLTTKLMPYYEATFSIALPSDATMHEVFAIKRRLFHLSLNKSAPMSLFAKAVEEKSSGQFRASGAIQMLVHPQIEPVSTKSEIKAAVIGNQPQQSDGFTSTDVFIIIGSTLALSLLFVAGFACVLNRKYRKLKNCPSPSGSRSGSRRSSTCSSSSGTASDLSDPDPVLLGLPGSAEDVSTFGLPVSAEDVSIAVIGLPVGTDEAPCSKLESGLVSTGVVVDPVSTGAASSNSVDGVVAAGIVTGNAVHEDGDNPRIQSTAVQEDEEAGGLEVVLVVM